MPMPEDLRRDLQKSLGDSQAQLALDLIRSVEETMKFAQAIVNAVGDISIREAKLALVNKFTDEIWKEPVETQTGR